MKKTFILAIAMVFISIGVKAQSAELLIGNWEFLEIHQSEKLDSQSLNTAMDMFYGTRMDFLDDGTYYFSGFGNDEEGTYTLTGKKIKAKSEDGKVSEMEIISLTEDKLIIKLGKVSLVMVPSVEEDYEEEEDNSGDDE